MCILLTKTVSVGMDRGGAGGRAPGGAAAAEPTRMQSCCRLGLWKSRTVGSVYVTRDGVTRHVTERDGA